MVGLKKEIIEVEIEEEDLGDGEGFFESCEEFIFV